MDHDKSIKLNIIDVIFIISAASIFFYGVTRNPSIVSANITDPDCPFLLRVGGVLGTAGAIASYGSVFPITLLILWFRQPRACFQVLIRKPGFSACLIWSLSIAFFLITKLSSLLFQWREQANPIDFVDIAKAPDQFCVDYLRRSFIPPCVFPGGCVAVSASCRSLGA